MAPEGYESRADLAEPCNLTPLTKAQFHDDMDRRLLERRMFLTVVEGAAATGPEEPACT